jgi:hypothetical protein
MFINIEVINYKENIDIHFNLKKLNIMVLEKCHIGRKLHKLIEE